MPFSWPRDPSWVSCIGRQMLPCWAIWEAHADSSQFLNSELNTVLNTVTKLPVTLNAEVVLTPDGLPEENSLTLNSWAVRFSASTRVKTQAPASISDVTVMPNLWGPPLTTVSSPAKPYPPASRRYKLTTFSFTEKSPMQCPHLHIYFHSNNME